MNYSKMGEFLKDLRIQRNLTQKDLADLLLITPQTVSKWELGSSVPNIEMLLSLRKIYGVSIDEIVNGEVQGQLIEVGEKHISRVDVRNLLLYIIYGLMIIISFIFPLFNFYVTDARIINYGVNLYPFNHESYPDFEAISITLKNSFIILPIIFLPILLLVLKLVDRNKGILLGISIFSLLLLLTYQIPLIASPSFVGPEIGFILFLFYTLLLTLSIIIVLSFFNVNFYQLLQVKTKQMSCAIGLFLITILIPFNAFNNHYYFKNFDHYLFLFLLLTTVFIIFESITGVKHFITGYYFLLGLILFYTMLENFYNSWIFSMALLKLFYLLLLIIANYEQKRFEIRIKQDWIVTPIIAELVSVMVYLYIYISRGDLFFGNSETIHLIDTPIGKYFHFNIILLVVAMGMRRLNSKLFSILIYTIWIAWLTFFTKVILVTYVLDSNYTVTDGMLLFVPPITYLIYLLTYVSYMLSNKQEKIESLNPISLGASYTKVK